MALPAPADGSGPSYFGVYPALVTDIVDPDRLGRVQVRFPWLGKEGDRDVRAWATLCTPYADVGQGLQIMPELDSQVVVAFEAGNLRRPYVVGAAWNGDASVPQLPQRPNNIRVLRSRAGSRLEFDDTSGAPKVTVSTDSGHQVVLDAGGGQEVVVRHASGCTVRLTTTGVEISGNVTVDVNTVLVTVDAPLATFSGIVKCQTLIAESVVMSPSYTPGAGNFW
jgi:uncharacterized protein involved in type VI secretion and phage assembly